MRFSGVLLTVAAAGFLLAGCDLKASSASADTQGSASTAPTSTTAKNAKVAACTEALGLADLNPLIDADRLKQRAQEKADRLHRLANDVQDQDVKDALAGMADSYIQVQKERWQDATVIAKWIRNNLSRLDTLRKACA